MSGLVLYANYYDSNYRKNVMKCAEFESEMFQNTKSYLSIARVPQTVMIRDIFVVVHVHEELRVFMCGTEDMDEIMLLEIIPIVGNILDEQLDVGKCNEKHLLDPGNYGKVSVSLDEFVAADGVVEQTDVDTINRLAKLKSV